MNENAVNQLCLARFGHHLNLLNLKSKVTLENKHVCLGILLIFLLFFAYFSEATCVGNPTLNARRIAQGLHFLNQQSRIKIQHLFIFQLSRKSNARTNSKSIKNKQGKAKIIRNFPNLNDQ